MAGPRITEVLLSPDRSWRKQVPPAICASFKLAGRKGRSRSGLLEVNLWTWQGTVA